MRIISGIHKGRKIFSPRNLPVRPTTERAREGLFNILENTIDMSLINVLDLFSGTGIISYEFSSRGVKKIISVDKNYNCIKHIKKTSNNLNLNISTVKNEVILYLKKPLIKFNLIFADPPYDWTLDYYKKMINLIFEKEWLLPNGILIIEHSKKTKLDQIFQPYFSRNYGDNNFSFYKKKQAYKPDSV
tara:strand:- start:10657 stop:11220 length:564 start_codon:yes stop_codon:yes gene_type:complete